MSGRPYQFFNFILAFLCVFNYADARTLQEPERVQASQSSNSIEIRIEPSRSQPAAGTGIGIMAEIKNLSQSKIYLNEKNITLSLPPELDPCVEVTGWYGFFPTETDSADSFSNSLWLMPGEAYKIFWNRKACDTPKGTAKDMPKDPTKTQQQPGQFYQFLQKMFSPLTNLLDVVYRELNFIFFSPGDYKITVTAKYWIGDLAGDYHIATQTTTLQVTAPQSVILFGAAIGGLIAYLLLPQARRRLMKPAQEITMPVDTFERFIKSLPGFIGRIAMECAGLGGSVLLSAIITILLSRISETQFLIRITVADFWGAITVGFVANYLGTKFLDKIIGSETSNHQKPPTTSEEGDLKTDEQRKDDAAGSST